MSAEERAEACALTSTRTMDQSQVRGRICFTRPFGNDTSAFGTVRNNFLNSAVADAWRALKSPSLGESSLDGAVSGLSTTSPSEGLSVAPGALGETPHFNTLAGGALGTRTCKYSR